MDSEELSVIEMSLESLRADARKLPSQGGAEIGAWLEKYASEVPKGSAIVELGCWLGAGTAFLAIGANQSGASIHVYDRFNASAEEVVKARKFGVDLIEGQDTLPLVKGYMASYRRHNLVEPIRIHLERCNLKNVTWLRKWSVGLYVDDATKVEPLWLHAMETFKPYFIPGKTILVLMDYHFDEKAGDKYAAQKRYMIEHSDEFEIIGDRLNGTTTAVFRYLG